jgi:ArsR family transcriptional regulator
MLLDLENELCVCELTHALALSQPKISRHIALLRNEKILTQRKVGKWVYYQISKDLPDWQKEVLKQTQFNNKAEWKEPLVRLNSMSGRPDRASICCN